VHIVVVAVVGEADGDEGFQLRRAAGRDLQAVEATPGFAKHAKTAVTPGLCGDPGHHFQAVVLFLFEIFVIQNAIGFTAAANVYPDAGITVSGKVGMANGISNGCSIVLSIGNVLKQSRARPGIGLEWEPDAGGEPGAVSQRNPGIFYFADSVRKISFDALHGQIPFDLLLVVINSSG